MIGGESFSTSGNLKWTTYSLSGASSTGMRSSFLILDCASEDFAALYRNLSIKARIVLDSIRQAPSYREYHTLQMCSLCHLGFIFAFGGLSALFLGCIE